MHDGSLVDIAVDACGWYPVVPPHVGRSIPPPWNLAPPHPSPPMAPPHKHPVTLTALSPQGIAVRGYGTLYSAAARPPPRHGPRNVDFVDPRCSQCVVGAVRFPIRLGCSRFDGTFGHKRSNFNWQETDIWIFAISHAPSHFVGSSASLDF